MKPEFSSIIPEESNKRASTGKTPITYNSEKIVGQGINNGALKYTFSIGSYKLRNP